MKILILGGTRFIGKSVASQAAARGHEVVLFNRGQTRSDSELQTLRGDVDRLVEHKDALRDLRADVAIHAIAYTEKHAQDAVEVFGGSSTRLVVLSSQDCYEAFYQLNQDRDVAELPLAEDAELCKVRHYWSGRPGAKVYSDYDKNLVTDVALAAHRAGKLSTCVLRLPMVFGPGDFQFAHRHGKIIRRLHDHHSTLMLGALEQAKLFTFGYIDNVAAAILRAAERPSLDGRAFNLGEEKSRSMRRWADLYAEAAGTRFDYAVVPDALIDRDLASLDKPPMFLLFDSTAFRREADFRDPVPLDEQVRRTLAWGLEHPDALGPKPDYASERDLIARYRAFIALPPLMARCPPVSSRQDELLE